jgi:hypothetical protein
MRFFNLLFVVSNGPVAISFEGGEGIQESRFCNKTPLMPFTV